MESFDQNLSIEQLPFSAEAEQAILGAILLNSQSFLEVVDILTPEYFYIQPNKELYNIFVRMFALSIPIDIVTVLEEVKTNNIFNSESEAKEYLTQLANFAPTTKNIISYAKIVKEKFYVRSLILIAHNIINNSNEFSNDANSLLDFAEQSIFELRQNNKNKGLQKIGEIVIGAYDNLQRLFGADKEDYIGIPTGFTGLDRILMGLNKSDLILLAARPAMGKTAFALNIATNVALKYNKKVALFSLEMSKEQLVTRVLSYVSRIPNNTLKMGSLELEDWENLAQAAQELSNAPIYIDDTANITTAEMKAKVRRLGGVDIVIIDYLQLMSTGNRRYDNRVQEISEITRSLKIMAKEFDVPVITLSQLSRSPDIRTDHEPKLSDLRESGSIEQDADVVMFLYRDSYYNKASEFPNMAECIVAKNRHGETNKVSLSWDGQYTKFESVEWNRDEN